MTVLIKYPHQTKKLNEDFFKRKDQELTNLNWTKWAGWFDTDGFFITEEYKKGKFSKKTGLKLKDRQPVKLFSKTFEGSLCYSKHKTITPEPYRKEYIAKEYTTKIHGPKAIWFTKNVYPYLIKEEKKDYAARLLGYRPASKNFTTWTRGEITHYLATATEGDGHIRCGHYTKEASNIDVTIASSDVQYLSDIRYLLEKKLAVTGTLSEHSTYETQEGIKTKYTLAICCSQRNPQNINFFQNLVKDNVMTLDRKKQKVEAFVSYIS